ncbi:MAG TPA: nuclear transport factor 2 family protein [Acidimicrobiales bacterium]|nr:nuclear transport factor 2 family protein [Acidimicrobiales bacterium]
MDTIDALRAANQSFYDAFEARDMDAMSNLWEHSDRALCTHPGWATLRGWGHVAASFFALFQNRDPIQFILTNEKLAVQGDVGWVSVDENILGEQSGSTVAALNVFVREPAAEGREEDPWRMICHHGSVVIPTPSRPEVQ